MEMRLQKVKEQAIYRGERGVGGSQSHRVTVSELREGDPCYGLGGNTGDLQGMFRTSLNPWSQVS